MNSAKRTFDPKKHSIYTPMNEEKYMDKDPIICKSSWETKFCEFCDHATNVIKWSSESLQIPYYDNIKKKNRRYFPDFIMTVKETDGKIQTYVIEIKPYKETIPPIIHGNKKGKTVMYEFLTWQTNLAKWKAAQIFCRKRGVIFRIITEKDLFKEQGK